MPNAIIRPNANGSANEWSFSGAPTAYQCVNKTTTQPTIPNLSSLIGTIGIYNIQQFNFETIENIDSVTQLDIWIYAQCDMPSDPITPIEIILPTETLNAGTISPDTTAQWFHLTINSLDLSQEDIDDIKISITSGDYGGNSGNIYCIYIDATYTVQSNIDPLPKRQPQMSGYNYFVKDYIKQKNKSEPCRKLPDGTIF